MLEVSKIWVAPPWMAAAYVVGAVLAVLWIPALAPVTRRAEELLMKKLQSTNGANKV